MKKLGDLPVFRTTTLNKTDEQTLNKISASLARFKLRVHGEKPGYSNLLRAWISILSNSTDKESYLTLLIETLGIRDVNNDKPGAETIQKIIRQMEEEP
jgi:hypothetical protein